MFIFNRVFYKCKREKQENLKKNANKFKRIVILNMYLKKIEIIMLLDHNKMIFNIFTSFFLVFIF